MHALMQAQYKASEVTERGKETAQETLASSQHSAHHVLPQVGFISLWLRTGQLHCCLAGRYCSSALGLRSDVMVILWASPHGSDYGCLGAACSTCDIVAHE